MKITFHANTEIAVKLCGNKIRPLLRVVGQRESRVITCSNFLLVNFES